MKSNLAVIITIITLILQFEFFIREFYSFFRKDHFSRCFNLFSNYICFI